MELEEFKSAWAQYDKKLSANLKLNEELLRSINLDKYDHALKKPLNLELLNIFIQTFMIGAISVLSIRLLNEIQYLIMGLISILICTTSLIFSIVKATRFNKLLNYHLSIINYQKDLTLLKMFILRLRTIEYIIAALLGITLAPFMIKATANIDVFNDLSHFIPLLFIVLVLAFVVGTLLNMKIYDKGIKDAGMFLGIIEKFGKEE